MATAKQDQGYLQVLPQGLLGFLQIKTAGGFPKTLSQELIPTLDLLEWYAQLNSETVFSAVINAIVSASASGANFPEFNVPNGQVWIAHEYIVSFGVSATGSATSCQANIGRPASGGSTTAAYVSDPENVAANSRVFCHVDRMLILGPGSTAGYLIGPVLTAAVPTQGTMTFARCTL